jgi:NADH-quinone oxidoreductase subunit J
VGLVGVIFLVLAAGSIVFAANVVLRRNPAACAVNLVGTFFCLSGIYLLIGFPFLAAIQLMVYAGAIMVLFLFVIMLLDLRQEEPRNTPIGGLLAPLFAAAVLGLVVPFFPDAEVKAAMNLTPIQGETASWGGQGLAVALFGRHMIVFEATSLLLLAGILGVVVLAKRRPRPGEDAPASDLGESGR